METKTSALADVSVIVASPLRDHEERIIPKHPQPDHRAACNTVSHNSPKG
jgi:hypothetical protein